MSESERVLVSSTEGRVLILTLNRPRETQRAHKGAA